MGLRSDAMKVIDQAFEETDASGKVAILALELKRLTIVPRQLIDDVRHLVQLSQDADFDIADAKVAIAPIRRAIRELDQPDK